MNINVTGQRFDITPGVFGPHERLGIVYSRKVEGFNQEVLVAPANIMEAGAGDWWIAWPEGDYLSHFVSQDRFEAARVVLDRIYGKVI